MGVRVSSLLNSPFVLHCNTDYVQNLQKTEENKNRHFTHPTFIVTLIDFLVPLDLLVPYKNDAVKTQRALGFYLLQNDPSRQ